MRYAIYPINPNKSYGITIGSRVKPDSELRELIRSQIDKVMGSFERNDPQTHRVAIVPDWDSAESGSPDIPGNLESRNQYLIFAILYSSEPDSAESLSYAELEYYREEIGAMLEGISGEETRAALVLLRDCSVSVIEADRSGDWFPWDSDLIEPRDTPERRYGA